jgi:class 3 adenylate cyclase
MVTSGDAQDPLKSHRSEITVVFIDLRGYTAFTENSRARRGDGRASRISLSDG